MLVFLEIMKYFCLFLGNTDWGIQRNYDSHIENMEGCKISKGCICKPVMPFNAESCPPDMLHMKKGIITKLINQLVDWSVLQKKEEVLTNQMKIHKIPFVCVLTDFFILTIICLAIQGILVVCTVYIFL